MKSKLVKQFQEKIKVDFVQFIEVAVQCLLLGRGFINERLDTSDHQRFISMHLKYKNVISSANFELTLGKRPSALMAVPTSWHGIVPSLSYSKEPSVYHQRRKLFC